MKKLLFVLLGCIFTSILFAKEINFYDQPKVDSKVIGKVDLSVGIIPIFTSKEGDWVKIADPRNGNVGWAKATDLQNNDSSTMTFTQQYIHNGAGPHSFQIIQYGQPQKLTESQMKERLQKMQIRQQNMQQSIQQSIQNMMREMDNLNKEEWNMLNGLSNFPFIVPILVVPAKQTPSQNASKPSQITSSTTPPPSPAKK